MIERICGLMKEHKMTAKELANQLGVAPSTISDWRSGKTKPSVEHVRKIANIFGVTTDYIINGTCLPPIQFDQLDHELDTTMLDIFKRLSTEKRDAVRDFFYLCVREMTSTTFQLETAPENISSSDFDPSAPEADNSFLLGSDALAASGFDMSFFNADNIEE